jgi:hypothetical protein
MRKRKAIAIAALSSGLASIAGCSLESGPPPLDVTKIKLLNTVAVDSLGKETWGKYLTGPALNKAWSPQYSSPWFPYHKTTLMAAVSLFKPVMAPVPQQEAEQRAKKFIGSADLANSAVFLDLPQAQSVAWAAVLASEAGFQPVATFNNWPHQSGTLKLEYVLASMLYYAGQAEGARAKIDPKTARPAFMFQAERISKDKTVPSSEFDNRYFLNTSDLPDVATLSRNGVKKVYYVLEKQRSPLEEDDLNSYFLGLSMNKIELFWVMVPATGDKASVASLKVQKRDTVFSDTATSSRVASTPHRSYHGFWRSSSGGFGGSHGWSGGS